MRGEVLQEVVHLVVQLQGVVQEAVIDGGRAAHQEVVHGVLEADVAVGLRGQGVLRGAGDAGEAADQVAVHDARADERVAVVDVLHDDLVTAGQVIGVRAVAGTRGLAELTGGIDREGGPVGDLDVEVRTEVVPVEQGAGVGSVILYGVGDTFLPEVTEGDEVLHPLGTAGDVQVRLVLRSDLVELLLVQVVVGIVEGRGVLELLLLGGGEVRHRIHFLRGEVAVVLELPQVIVVIDVGGQAFVAGIGLLLVADGLVAEQGVFVGRHALLQLGGLCEAVVG